MTKEEIMEAIENMTVLELSELVKAMEDKFGVSAAAPVAVAAAPAAGGAAAEEKSEFDVILQSAGDKKIGVIKVVRLHDLRHSHASLLIEMGFSPLVIADRLGHEKITTTLQIYSHLYPNKQAEVAEKLDTVDFNF